GSLIPVAVNLQLGGGHSLEITSSTTTVPVQTTLLGAVGLSVPLPTPVVKVEPYVSPGIRYHHYANGAPNQTNFGWVIGGNVGLGRGRRPTARFGHAVPRDETLDLHAPGPPAGGATKSRGHPGRTSRHRNAHHEFAHQGAEPLERPAGDRSDAGAGGAALRHV